MGITPSLTLAVYATVWGFILNTLIATSQTEERIEKDKNYFSHVNVRMCFSID